MLTTPLPSSYELPLRSHTDLCRFYSLLLLRYDHRDSPPKANGMAANRPPSSITPFGIRSTRVQRIDTPSARRENLL